MNQAVAFAIAAAIIVASMWLVRAIARGLGRSLSAGWTFIFAIVAMGMGALAFGLIALALPNLGLIS